MPADLHLHSFFSDGTYSPEEVVHNASLHGITTLALTDHDTVEGCARAASACEATGIEFIPGSELTSEHGDREFHLLGYFLDIQHPGLLKELAVFQNVRQQRIREMVEQLNKLGVPMEAEIVFKLANCRAPGRPHVARALVQEGFCRSLDEAFERYLKVNRPAWVPKFKMDASSAIRLIHDAGGIAVLAHPGINRHDQSIPPLIEAGLDGIECFHTKHSPKMSSEYLAMAARHDAVATGGSDCHGMSKGRPLIGTVKLADEFVGKMRERRARMHESKPATVLS